ADVHVAVVGGDDAVRRARARKRRVEQDLAGARMRGDEVRGFAAGDGVRRRHTVRCGGYGAAVGSDVVERNAQRRGVLGGGPRGGRQWAVVGGRAGRCGGGTDDQCADGGDRGEWWAGAHLENSWCPRWSEGHGSASSGLWLG